MRRALLVLAILLAAVAAVLLLPWASLLGDREGALDRSDEEAASAESATPADETQGLRGTPGAEAAKPPEAPDAFHGVLLRGSVRDRDTRQPIPGATVRVYLAPRIVSPRPWRLARKVATGEDGQFSCRVPTPRAQDAYAEATAPGYRIRRQRLALSAARTNVFDVLLEPAGRIAGRVIDENDAPVAKARVWLVGRGGQSGARRPPDNKALPRPVTTGSDGRFEIESVPLDAAFALAAAAPGDRLGTSAASFTVPRAARRVEDVVMRVLRAGSVRGRLVDATGAPLVAHVYLTYRGVTPYAQRTRHDYPADGVIDFPGLLPGPYVLKVSDWTLGKRTLGPDPIEVKPGAVTDLGTLRPATGLQVSGQLRLVEGDPEEGPLDVWMRLVQGERIIETHAAVGGAFLFRDVPPGIYALQVSDEEFRLRRPVKVRAGQTDVNVDVVGPSAMLEISVHLAEGGKAEDFGVLIIDDDPVAGVLRQSWAADGGFFRSDPLAPGAYHAIVLAEDRALWHRAGVHLATGETKRLAVVLDRAPRLRGRVLAADGTPVDGARVVLSEPNDTPIIRTRNAVGWADHRSVNTGADGSFVFSVSRPDLRVWATAGGHGVAVADVGAGGERDLVLPAGSPVRGRLVDASGRSLAGTQVYLRPPDAPVTIGRQALTDDGGRFVFAEVSPGVWILYVIGIEGHLVSRRSIDVPGGSLELGDVRADGG